MKKILLFLLISSSAWAQQSTPKKAKYGIEQFMLIGKVEDQEKKYNEVLKEPSDHLTATALNDLRAELAYHWLASSARRSFKAVAIRSSDSNCFE